MNTDNNLPPRFPYLIDVELTNKCNLNCSFCSRQFMHRKQGFMKDSTFNSIVNQIEETKTPIRFIRWGEPFLHKNIINYAKKLKTRNIPLHITTNGLLLNKKICDEIVSIGIDSIIFSIQGLTKVSYEKERNNKKYDILEKNIKMLYDTRGENENPFITISATSQHKKGVETFINKWSDYSDDIQIGVTNYSRINNEKGQHIVCKEPWQKMSIDWDGNVSACCGDYDKLLNIGNIDDSTLFGLWNGDILDSYRELIKNEKHDSLSLCSKCYPAHGDIWNE